MILKHRDRELLRFEWLEPQGVRVVSVNESERKFLPLEMKGAADDDMRMDSKIEYRGEVKDYLLQYQPKKKCGIITFKINYSGDDYKFRIIVDDSGTASIHLTPEDRDFIDYKGTVNEL